MTIFLYLPIIIFTGNYTNFLILIFNFEKMNFVQYILLVLNKIISNRFFHEFFTVYLEKIILVYILKDTILLIYRISFNIGCMLCIIF